MTLGDSNLRLLIQFLKIEQQRKIKVCVCMSIQADLKDNYDEKINIDSLSKLFPQELEDEVEPCILSSAVHERERK